MITGANTNVRHRGRVFHVQTEDSGRANPHIISHVYHGGTIIASLKSDYGDRDGPSDDDIRGLIEAQHKALLKRLVHGEFDADIDHRLGTTTGSPITEVPPTEPPPTEPPPTEPPPANADSAGASSGSTTADASTSPTSSPSGVPAPTAPGFGDSVDSKKPLDEVILEYLVEKARNRGGETKTRSTGSTRPARPARQKG